MIHGGFRLLISHYPLSQNPLSLKGSAGCLLCSVHEASEIYLVPKVFRGASRGSVSAPITIRHEWGRLEGE